ncbi:MAG: hypothetical protein AAGI68_10180 [Planctomycetota bacterium]
MRYRVSGLIRDTGKPVEGHVTAPETDTAFAVLADNGIVTSSLRPDPVPGGPPGGPLSDAPRDEFTEAIDSAFDLSATDVSVDKLAQKFRGQKVRVVDRDKIRDRVKTVVGNAISAAGKNGGNDGQQETLDKVAEALDKMFGDNQNLTSEQPASMVAMEEQIARLMKVTRRIEMAVNRLVAGGGGGGGGNYRYDQRKRSEEQNQVLLEIFQTNKDLRDQIDGKSTPPASIPTPAETAG